MINPYLTEGKALERIGEVRMSEELLITKESKIPKILNHFRHRIDELFEEKQIYYKDDVGSHRHRILAENFEGTDQEWFSLLFELKKLHNSVSEVFRKITALIPPTTCRDIFPERSFQTLLFEAVWNSIEHGTAFCSKGDVRLEIKKGVNGLLGMVFQSTPGPDHLQMQRLTTPFQWGETLTYRTELGDIRGHGFGIFRGSDSEVGFESEENPPSFKTLMLYLERF